MSNQEINSELPDTVNDHAPADNYAIGRLRLLPAVAFGLRAAALAGLIVTAGAAGLDGVFDDPPVLTIAEGEPGGPGHSPDPSTCC